MKGVVLRGLLRFAVQRCTTDASFQKESFPLQELNSLQHALVDDCRSGLVEYHARELVPRQVGYGE